MSQSSARISDRTRLIASALFFAVTVAVIFFSGNRPAAISATATPAQIMPLDPTVRANLQNVSAQVLPADQQETVQQIQTMLNDCPDYGEARRSPMQQHIAWLLDPSGIPTDILMAIGANPRGKLMVGMATYTAVEWRLLNRPAESCLLPIGKLVNTLLAANGEPTEPAFTTP